VAGVHEAPATAAHPPHILPKGTVVSEIDDKVAALRFELAQVKDHTGAGFRDRATAIEAEIADWLTPGAPDEVPPSEHVDDVNDETPAPEVIVAPPAVLQGSSSTDTEQ
jgi:hypothetical protein